MKIAQVYDAVYPWEKGGIQKRVWEISRRLADDHDIHWYGCKYWDGPDVYEREGVTLHGVTPPGELYVNGRRSIGQALSFTAHLTPTLVRTDFDLVHVQEFPYFPCFSGKAAGLLRGIPLVVTWHEIWDEYWEEYLGALGPVGRSVERLAVHLPDIHVAVSRRTRADVEAMADCKAHLVPNGISLEEIRTTKPAADPPDVVYVGRLIEQKNVDLLLEALAAYREHRPTVTCDVIGEGPEESDLRTLATDLGVDSHIRFRGFLEEYEDVLGVIKGADVLVLPSRREGFGITALEALACGTPVVTIDHPRNAATALVDDGRTGYICSPESEAVARAIEQATTTIDPEACVEAAQQYDWDQITARMERLYKSVTACRGYP